MRKKNRIPGSEIESFFTFLFVISLVEGEIELSNLTFLKTEADVAIVVNSGGWGNVPLYLAADLKPIVDGIRGYLEGQGLRTVVVTYYRVRPDLKDRFSLEDRLGFITELIGLHQTRARCFAARIETAAAVNPETKFILIGLSNGGAFVDNTVELLSPKLRDRVIGITIGVPFWRGLCEDSNVLHINDEDEDPLAGGDLGELMRVLINRFLSQVWHQIREDELKLGKVLHIPGHSYSYKWQSIERVITGFIDRRWFNTRTK